MADRYGGARPKRVVSSDSKEDTANRRDEALSAHSDRHHCDQPCNRRDIAPSELHGHSDRGHCDQPCNQRDIAPSELHGHSDRGHCDQPCNRRDIAPSELQGHSDRGHCDQPCNRRDIAPSELHGHSDRGHCDQPCNRRDIAPSELHGHSDRGHCDQPCNRRDIAPSELHGHSDRGHCDQPCSRSTPSAHNYEDSLASSPSSKLNYTDDQRIHTITMTSAVRPEEKAVFKYTLLPEREKEPRKSCNSLGTDTNNVPNVKEEDSCSKDEFIYFLDAATGEIVRRPKSTQHCDIKERNVSSTLSNSGLRSTTSDFLSKLNHAVPFLPERLRNQWQQVDNGDESGCEYNPAENGHLCLDTEENVDYLSLNKTHSEIKSNDDAYNSEVKRGDLSDKRLQEGRDKLDDSDYVLFESSLEDPFNVRAGSKMSLCSGIMDMMERLSPPSLSPTQESIEEHCKEDHRVSKYRDCSGAAKSDKFTVNRREGKNMNKCNCLCKHKRCQKNKSPETVKTGRCKGFIYPFNDDERKENVDCDTKPRNYLCSHDDCDIACSHSNGHDSETSADLCHLTGLRTTSDSLSNTQTNPGAYSVQANPGMCSEGHAVSQTDGVLKNKKQNKQLANNSLIKKYGIERDKWSIDTPVDLNASISPPCRCAQTQGLTSDILCVCVNKDYKFDSSYEDYADLGLRLFASPPLNPCCYGDECEDDCFTRCSENLSGCTCSGMDSLRSRESYPSALCDDQRLCDRDTEHQRDKEDEDLSLPRLLPDDLYLSSSRSPSFDLEDSRSLSSSSANLGQTHDSEEDGVGIGVVLGEGDYLDQPFGTRSGLTQQTSDMLTLRSVTDPFMEQWNWNFSYDDSDLVGDTSNFGFPMELTSLVVNGMDTFLMEVLQVNFMLTFLLQRMPELLSDLAGVPTPQSVIDSLPLVDVDNILLEQHPSCPICLASTQISDQMSQLPCQHVFHPTCVRAWLNKSATCPVCRQSVVTV